LQERAAISAENTWRNLQNNAALFVWFAKETRYLAKRRDVKYIIYNTDTFRFLTLHRKFDILTIRWKIAVWQNCGQADCAHDPRPRELALFCLYVRGKGAERK
jgi:hypothetical protein